MPGLNQYFEITKADAEQRMVWGYCSTEAVDVQGETITKSAMEDAWDEYMKFANVREMHQPSAVGIVKEYEFRDEGIFIGAKIVDDSAWNKVQEGVYKGFSVGGKKKPGGYNALTKTITAMRLSEISLVDRPANPEALIEMFKADTLENDNMNGTNAEAIAALIAKGNITPERLQELLEAEVAKAEGATGEQTAPQAAQPTTEVQPEATPAAAQTEAPTDTQKADAEPKLSPVQTALRLIAGGDEESIKKGIYDIQSLASLLGSLSYLQMCTSEEATREGDGSAVPGKLAALAKEMGNILLELAQEEVGELMATLKSADGAADKEPLALLTEKVASLIKQPDAASTIQKGIVGELAQMQFDEGAINKAVADAFAGYAERFDEIAKSVQAHDDIVKTVAPLKEALDTLQKRFDKLPSVPKGALSTVAKSEDGDALLTQPPKVTGPVLKADGSIDVEAEIKKVHQSGGRRL